MISIVWLDNRPLFGSVAALQALADVDLGFTIPARLCIQEGGVHEVVAR
jgi:hypothetical protein